MRILVFIIYYLTLIFLTALLLILLSLFQVLIGYPIWINASLACLSFLGLNKYFNHIKLKTKILKLLVKDDVSKYDIERGKDKLYINKKRCEKLLENQELKDPLDYLLLLMYFKENNILEKYTFMNRDIRKLVTNPNDKEQLLKKGGDILNFNIKEISEFFKDSDNLGDYYLQPLE